MKRTAQALPMLALKIAGGSGAVAGSALLIFGGMPANAQSWTPDLKVGDAFNYSFTGPRGSYSYTRIYAGKDPQGRHVFDMRGNPAGHTKVYFTWNMTFIGFATDGTVPHSFNSKHPQKKGDRWTGTFRATYDGYSREMRCQVDKENPSYKVGSQTRHATRVYCNGRRTDRPRGQVYTMWFDQKTGLYLGGNVDWGTGSYSWRMVSMKLVPR